MTTTFAQETDATSTNLVIEERAFRPSRPKISYRTAEKFATVGGSSLLYRGISVPGTSGILRKAWSTIPKIENVGMAQEAKRLLTAIDQTIYLFHESRLDVSSIPALQAFRPDDGSLLFEWILDDFRVGFSIEPSLTESSWYLVSTPALGEISASGKLTGVDIKILTTWLLTFMGLNQY